MSELKRLEQLTIENKFSKHNLIEILSEHVRSRIPKKIEQLFDAMIEYCSIPSWESKGTRLAHLMEQDLWSIAEDIAMILVPLEGSRPIQSVATMVAAHLNYADPWDGIKTASELITIACDIDLCDIDMPSCSETGSLIVKSRYKLPADIRSRLAQVKYLPPMICPPNQIRSNSDSGYLDSKHDSIILNNNHHNEKQCLDVINIQNGIPLSIDEEVLAEDEESTKPLDTVEKRTNFNTLVSESSEVYADLLSQGNKFYFTHKYDSRGRLYSQGYHVNYQGTPYKRALISLCNKELVI